MGMIRGGPNRHLYHPALNRGKQLAATCRIGTQVPGTVLGRPARQRRATMRDGAHRRLNAGALVKPACGVSS